MLVVNVCEIERQEKGKTAIFLLLLLCRRRDRRQTRATRKGIFPDVFLNRLRMTTNLDRTIDDHQQLIPMSSIVQDIATLNDNHVNTTSQTDMNNSNERDDDFLSRLLRVFNSIHLPILSDRLLRIIFLLFITFIGLTSFTIALVIGSSLVQFKHQCPLYASFKYQLFTTYESNWTIKINPLTEKFSSQSTCDFCTFSNVFIFIFCIITGFFFILFNGDQRIVKTNDQCLIIPWFPMSLILGLFSLINASILTNGFLKFCSTILDEDHRLRSCRQLNDLYFEQYPNVSSLFFYMLIAIIFSWIQLIFFIGTITILTIRLGSSIDLSSQHNHRLAKKSVRLVNKSTEQI